MFEFEVKSDVFVGGNRIRNGVVVGVGVVVFVGVKVVVAVGVEVGVFVGVKIVCDQQRVANEKNNIVLSITFIKFSYVKRTLKFFH